jgi:protein mago nashi
VGPSVQEEVSRIVIDSEIFAENDELWPLPDKDGRQELEVKIGDQHISFTVCMYESIHSLCMYKFD